MEIEIGRFKLTTDHPASHYGAGVLVNENGNGYGPSDLISKGKITPEMLFGYETPNSTVGDYVRSFVISSCECFTRDEIDFIRKYLSQSPEQIKLPKYDTLEYYWKSNRIEDYLINQNIRAIHGFNLP